MDLWDDVLAEEDRQSKARSLVNSPNLVLFFTKEGSVYGAPEDSRVIFAKMKAKNDEDGEKWKKDADFMAVNLTAYLDEGKLSQSVFGKKDLRKIKVLDKDEAEQKLLSHPKNTSKEAKVISVVVPHEEN